MVFDAASLASTSMQPAFARFKRAGLWQLVPFLVLAKHRLPFQFGPYCHVFELPFVTLKTHRSKVYYTIKYML